MLYVSNNGETCKDQLCQHPECWQTNVRRVREAVRQRNGIVSKQQIDHEPRRLRLIQKKKLSNNESLPLPTLKVIDVTRNIATPFDNYSDDDEQVLIEKAPSSTLYASPIRKAPRTTPVSPSLPERNRKNAKLKQKITCSELEDEKTKTVSFHEIYDYEEVCQDWQETFISSAYLVWCPSKKKREKRRSRKSSATTEHKTRGYADILEHALPLPMEETPKKRRKAKYPTGGQPYSPCRSPTIKHEHFKSADDISDGDFILTVTKEQIPKSLVTSKKIIEPKAITAIKEHPHLQGRVSDSTKVLVDISSRLASSPVVDTNQPASSKETEIIQKEDKKNTLDTQELIKQIKPIKPRRAKTAGTSQKQPSDFEARKVLPLPSVGIPWGLIPAARQGHCKSSIPHGVELGVVMEPVVYQARSASARGSKKKTCANVESSEGKTLNKAVELGNLTENEDERNHLTSAYRLSPRRLLAPAPTPITPGTREGGLRRQPSGLVRPNATRSSSKTVLPEHSSPTTRNQESSDGTEKTRSRHAPQRSKSLEDHVILEVEETNRNTFHEFVADFSKMSMNGTDRAESRNEATPATTNQHESADKTNDNESAISLRAVSPSSRTNIPPDIWAELRGDDDRRITPGKHLEIRQRDRVHSTVITRGYHSSLGLSVYSYIETSWKPTMLPRSFIGLRTSCQGPYEQTILPRMPASLTVVPVPCITRSPPAKGVVTEPRAYHLAQSSSIRMPPVPMGSPVLGMEVTLPAAESAKSSRTAVDSSESSEVRVVSEGTGPEHKNEGEGPEEVEYLIARDVVTHQEVPEKVGDVEQGLGVEILSVAKGDSCGSDSKDRPPESDVMNGQDDEDGKSASVVFDERSDALSKEAEQREACELRESMRDNETPEEKPADGSTIETMVVAERASKESDSLIPIEAQISTSDVKNSATQSSTEPKPQDSIPQDSIPQDSIPQDSIPQDSIPQDTIPQDSIPQDTIPQDSIPQDSIPQDSIPQDSIPKVPSSPRPSELQAPLEDLSMDLGGIDLAHASNNLNSNLLSASFKQMLAVTSHDSLISNDSDDFQLEPFNVESELLQPIHIESDLFLLSGDSYLELSFDESELDDHR